MSDNIFAAQESNNASGAVPSNIIQVMRQAMYARHLANAAQATFTKATKVMIATVAAAVALCIATAAAVYFTLIYNNCPGTN